MIVLVTDNFLFCKLVSKLVTITTNNFLSLKSVVNGKFAYSDKCIKKSLECQIYKIY